jgi:hypothetical protein
VARDPGTGIGDIETGVHEVFYGIRVTKGRKAVMRGLVNAWRDG